MKKNNNLFVISYYDNKNMKHITFIPKFQSFKELKNQYGKKITIRSCTQAGEEGSLLNY